MKTIIAYTLCICCIMFLLSGCTHPPVNSPDSNTSGQEQSNTGKQADPENKANADNKEDAENKVDIANEPLAQYVQTDIEETVKGSDKFSNNWEIPICIPKLLPFSGDAIACQAEIASIFEPWVADIRNNSSQGCWPDTAKIEYNTNLNGSVLSLVIHARSNFDSSIYYVYNFDIESGKKLNTDGLMKKLQVANYTERITQAAKSFFETKYAAAKNTNTGFYNQQLETTVSKENIGKAMPYVTKDGKLMVIVDIYALAGAKFYSEEIPLS